MHQSIDLYALLGYGCNFECSHCLNSSAKDRFTESISLNEYKSIAKEVNSNTKIDSVVFVGGEPSLYIDKMKFLQANITRSVQYSMVTNGSWLRRMDSLLRQVSLNEIVLSYEKFHQAFLTIEMAIAFVNAVKEHKIPIVLAAVYETQSELVQSAKLALRLGIELRPGRLARSGRAVNHLKSITQDAKSQHNSARIIGNQLAPSASFFTGAGCPSFERVIRASPNTSEVLQKEAVVFLPGKGFTICCGTLSFDEIASTVTLFSESVEGALNSNFAAMHRDRSAFEQFQNLNLDYGKTDCTTRCDSCGFLYKTEPQIRMSLADFVKKCDSEPFSFAIEKQLPAAWSNSLSPHYSLRYAYKAVRLAMEFEPIYQDISVFEEFDLEQGMLDKFLEHYQQIAAQCDHQLKELLLHSVDRFQNLWPRLAKKVGFKKINGNGQIVASILLMDHMHYPILGCKDAVVVAWWGLDKHELNEFERKLLKSRWSSLIREYTGDIKPTIALVHDVNVNGQKFAEKMGFQLVGGSLRKEFS